MLRVVQVVCQQQCNGDIVLVTLSSTAVETAIAQCTSRWAMARGHCLNTSIVLAAVHGLSGLFRTVSAVEPSLSRPLTTLSPSLIGHLASVDVKQHERKKKMRAAFIVQELCESRGARPSWAVRPNEPSGFCGRKAIVSHASALVSACP